MGFLVLAAAIALLVLYLIIDARRMRHLHRSRHIDDCDMPRPPQS